MRIARIPMWATIAVVAALCAGTAQGRGFARCAQCGTVLEVDPVVFEESDATRNAAEGTIISGVLGSRPDTGRQSGNIGGTEVNGLTGRLVKRDYTGPGTPGLRIKFKRDAGGHWIAELAGRPRLYPDDRILIKDGKVKLNY